MAQMHQGQMAGTRWDPGLYLKFSDHRLRPALEPVTAVSSLLVEGVPADRDAVVPAGAVVEVLPPFAGG